jgi:FtsH ternary system domain X7
VGQIVEVPGNRETGHTAASVAEPASSPADIAADRGAPTPTAPVRLAGRFHTAAAALVFAGQADGVAGLSAGALAFARSTAAHTWWAEADLPLDVGRELIAVARGEPFVRVDGVLLPDRGWGAPPTSASADRQAGAAPGDLAPVGLLDLVRHSGLQRTAGPTPDELVVLAPGRRVGPIVQRGLDLGLDTRLRGVRLHELFGEPTGPSSTAFEIVLRAADGAVPASFLTAIDRDPSALVCRRAGPALLIQHRTASALPDRLLARLAEQDGPEGGTWVLADAAYGCHRLHALDGGEPHDGAELVRLSDAYTLTGPVEGWADAPDQTPDQTPDEEPGEAANSAAGRDTAASGPATPTALAEPARPVLRLVPAATRGTGVDAMLLDDADLDCIPALLEGRPLADAALLAPGRDHHLLVAPGGLLENLPIGEPLYRVGPGSLYLPLGRRIQPSLPPTARRALFDAGPDTAVVFAHSDRALVFDLTACRPVWALWAGPVPSFDLQVPPEAAEAVAEVERLTAPPPAPAQPPDDTRSGFLGRIRELTDPHADGRERTWRDDAWDAERAGDLARAAEIHEANNDLRRAAHLYELAAREGRR